MSQLRRPVLALCVVMVLLTSTLGAGVGSVAAQDVPSLPATYYGELTVSDGSVDGPVVIDAVVDDEIQDSITTDADGSIGGPTISDEKLEVQEPENGTIEFHVGGEPITIQTLDGEAVGSQSIPFDSGVQEIELEADPAAISPQFNISITDTNTPVSAEDQLNVSVEIDNVGPIEATPNVELQNENETVVASTTTAVPIGESDTTTLSWTTTADDVGEQTMTVVAGDKTATTTVEIETPDIADPTPGGEDDGNNGGGQGGGVPGGGTSADDDSDETADPAPTEDGLRTSESQFIVSSEQFGISQVRFTEETPIAAITWETAEIPGELVTVDTYDQPPETVPVVPGDVLSISDVSVPENATDQPATIRYRADKTAVDDVAATSEEVTIVRLIDDRWEPLETTVTDETNDTVTLEAETPGFSYVAITATGPDAVIDAPESAADGAEITVSAENSTTPFGEIVSYNWVIGDETHTGASVTTTVNNPNETAIELTVENTAGATDTTTQTLTTSDSTPGFGIITVLSALLGSSLLLRYRNTR